MSSNFEPSTNTTLITVPIKSATNLKGKQIIISKIWNKSSNRKKEKSPENIQINFHLNEESENTWTKKYIYNIKEEKETSVFIKIVYRNEKNIICLHEPRSDRLFPHYFKSTWLFFVPMLVNILQIREPLYTPKTLLYVY